MESKLKNSKKENKVLDAWNMKSQIKYINLKIKNVYVCLGKSIFINNIIIILSKNPYYY